MNDHYLKQAEAHYGIANRDGSLLEAQLAFTAALIAIAERLETLIEQNRDSYQIPLEDEQEQVIGTLEL